MRKKVICSIAFSLVLIVSIIIYFKPQSFSNISEENSTISILLNEYSIQNGEPIIDVLEYKDINPEQESAVLSILEKYTYRRTLGTPFSNGSMTGLETKMLSIYVFDNSSDSNVFVLSGNEIVINGKNYRMKNAGQLIEQIIEILEQTD